jgi:hypothetical protein
MTFKEIINKIAVFVGFAAPIAESIEEVVAPATVAPTEAVRKVASEIESETE